MRLRAWPNRIWPHRREICPLLDRMWLCSDFSGGDDTLQVLQTDVLIVGGGTSGVTAALAAADEGASVLIMELNTGIGGIGTHGNIHTYYLGLSAGLQAELDRRTQEISE